MEMQSKGVTYQQEFDFGTLAEWARPHGSGEGASPEPKSTREQQVFATWKEAPSTGESCLPFPEASPAPEPSEISGSYP